MRSKHLMALFLRKTKSEYFNPEYERRVIWDLRSRHYFVRSSYNAYLLLKSSFSIFVIFLGLDKFLHILNGWEFMLLNPITNNFILMANSQPYVHFTLQAKHLLWGVGAMEMSLGTLLLFGATVWGGRLLLALYLILLAVCFFGGQPLLLSFVFFGVSLAALCLSLLGHEFIHYRFTRE